MVEPSTRPDHEYCVQFDSCSQACRQPSSLANRPRNGIYSTWWSRNISIASPQQIEMETLLTPTLWTPSFTPNTFEELGARTQGTNLPLN